MDISSIFGATVRPDPALLFRRDDPSDPRLGQVVLVDPEDFGRAEIVLLGCPQDLGVARNGGRVGAAAGPRAIRERLYRLVVPPAARLFDLGDTPVDGELEAIHARHHAIVAALLAAGKRVISLGGGNDLAYPDGAALASVFGAEQSFIANLDTHFDVRPDQPRNSGTPYRQLLVEGHVLGANFAELGHQPFAVAAAHRQFLADHGALVLNLAQWRQRGISSVIGDLIAQQQSKAQMWGLDLDVVRASDAPGVSAPNASGLSAEELLACAEVIGASAAWRVIELSELNPTYDLDGRTARLAASVIWTILAATPAHSA